MAAAQRVKDTNYQVRTPITHKRARGGLASDATFWLHRSDCLPAERPIAREGSCSVPEPFEDGSSMSTYCGNHEC